MTDLYDGFDDVSDTVFNQTIFNKNHANNNNNDDEQSALNSSLNMNETVRPMTSNKSAGYSSLKKNKTSNSNYSSSINNNNQNKNDNKSKNDMLSIKAEEMEQNVNKLLRESIFLSSENDLDSALDLAQQCRKKENQVISFREKHNLEENINSDLTFSVLFNLGYIYQLKKMYAEALNIYNLIINSFSSNNNNNNNKIEIISRVRVNIGNIYYDQEKYDLAIKHYRMSLDQIGDISYKLKILIMKNIGNSFIKLGQFVDAIQSFETIIELNINIGGIYGINMEIIIFNLIISYYTLGDKEKMKKGFIQLLNYSLSIPVIDSETDNDEYCIFIKKKWLSFGNYIKQSVQLIGKAIDSLNNEYSGYEWIIDNLYKIKSKHEEIRKSSSKYIEEFFNKIINEIIVLKGIEYLKDNKFDLAISVFNDVSLKMYNNLSFISYLKCEYELSSKYALQAIEYDRYNCLSLVNRANCLYIYGEYETAKEMYLEAIGVESDCIEAIYNLGLICKKIGNYNDSLQAFKKLNKIYKNKQNIEIIYQISNLYELLNEYEIAIKYYKILHSLIPFDSFILIKLANLYKIYLKDETLIYHNYLDSFKLNKCNINIISWIGIFYINNNLYENAINIFKIASIITNNKQIKWKLMIASCFRRMRNFDKAINIYIKILNKDNDHNNDYDIKIKCLQYLCTIMKQIDHPQLNKYQNQLNKYQNEIDHINHHQPPQQQHIQQQQPMQQHHDDQDDNDDDEDDDDQDDNWANVDIDDELLPS